MKANYYAAVQSFLQLTLHYTNAKI